MITRFDGGNVSDTRDLVRRVADAGVGREVEVIVLRDGAEETLHVTLGLRDEERLTPTAGSAQPQQPAAPSQMLGMEVMPLTEQMRTDMGLGAGTTGLVIGVTAPTTPIGLAT